MSAILAVLDAILNSLWEAAVVAALIGVLLKFARGMNAATRHAILWTTLCVVLVLPVAPRILPILRPRSAPATLAAAPTTARRATPSVEIQPFLVTVKPKRGAQWTAAVFGVWFLILVWRLTRIGRSYFYVRSLKQRASISSLPRPAIARRSDLLISRDIGSPIAVGFLHPAIVLPESLINQISEEDRGHVLMHESAHLARYDDWGNLFVRFLEAVLALHPVAIWILRRIEREREVICDDWVVARTGAARPYAVSLAHLFELLQLRREEALVGGLFGNGSSLRERIENLMRHGPVFSARASLRGVAGIAAALCVLLLATSAAPRWIAFAQDGPHFEAASIRLSKDPAPGGNIDITPGRFHGKDLALQWLILTAYGIKSGNLVGNLPSWTIDERYTIDATTSDASGEDRILLALRALLKDRFQLREHMETRQEPVYFLRAAKNGIAMPPGSCEPVKKDYPNECWAQGARGLVGTLDWRGVAMSDPGGVAWRTLAGQLSLAVRRTVIDDTGLQGTFDVHLKWARDPRPGETFDAANANAPSIFDAVREQLGLKLESGRGPVEYMVIDHAERPGQN